MTFTYIYACERARDGGYLRSELDSEDNNKQNEQRKDVRRCEARADAQSSYLLRYQQRCVGEELVTLQ